MSTTTDASLDERLVAGYDLDVDNAADVAPVGPTEPGLSTGFGQDQEDPQAAERFGVENPPAIDAATAATSAEDIEQQIRDLEARLDRMFDKAREGSDKPPAPVPSDKPSSPTPVPQRPSSPGQATADEVLSPEFYARQWGRAGLRSRSEEVDEFGLDPTFEQRLLPSLDFLYSRYFRVAVEGVQHIPAQGRCLIVANHSGGPLPYDGAMLRTAVRREHAAHRELRWLAEDFIYYLPFVGTFMTRIGAVRACQENAERLLGKGALVAVFPEGAKGIGKLYRDRYKLQRFGRGGFVRLCLRTRTPIVPCAIVGAEEANPMLYRIEYMTKALGIPYFPITPTFPALGPLGLMPAPTKWKIRFGEPFTWSGYGAEAADDEILVGRLSERVRASIQTMLDRMVGERRSVWFG
ncbi:MAG: 1-acyl-sn-glycerol-3-phosphate acyltransferase [Polyangiaceae bacterium]|nr:1-acyl-sn-glycerol-3-phosphate acyltransferase [Polyangiaceae bacterium]